MNMKIILFDYLSYLYFFIVPFIYEKFKLYFIIIYKIDD